MHKSAAALFAIAAGATIAAPAVAGQDTISLTLPAAEALLLAHNRELMASQHALDAAVADRISAGQRPNPTLSVSSVSIDPHRIGAGAPWEKNVDTAVQLSQLIERGGKRELRSEAADHAVLAARADADDVQRQQRLLLRQAYFDLHLAQERVAVSRQTVLAFQRTLDAANLRLKSGDIAAADVSRISVDALRAENDLRQNVGDLERARVTLGYLIGLEGRAADLEAADPWPELAPMPEAAEEHALDSRTDVRAALERVRAADKAAGLARAQRSRDVTVFAQFESFPGQQQNNTMGFGVSVPLFLNYSYDGEIRRAEVDREAARDNLERVRAVARTDVARARADLASARERAQRFDSQLIASAARAADAAEFAYRRGALGVMDLLDARRALHAAQVDAAGAHSDYAKALAAWRAAIGEAVGGQ